MLKPKCSSGTVLCKNPLFMDAVCKTLPIHITSVMLVNLNFLSSLTGTVHTGRRGAPKVRLLFA